MTTQLLRTYARSYQLTGNDFHRRTAEATGDWMLAEMVDEAGGFWSTLDADSEGVEGKFFVWDLDEVREVLGDDADEAIAAWGLTERGNFEGQNIPVRAADPSDPERLERARMALLERRATRVRPGTDTKVLAAWNGMACAAFAEAATALGRPDFLDAADRAMRFVLDKLRMDGRLMRSYRDGVVKHLGYAEDYALVLEGTLKLYEASGDVTWLREARWAADEAIRLFHDGDAGGFFTTGSDAERLVTRSKDLIDNAVPAANSVFAVELQRLVVHRGAQRYETKALEIVRLLHDAMGRSPLGFGHLLGAVDLYTGSPLEIVIVGSPSEERSQLERVVRERFLPNSVVVLSVAASEEEQELIPLLEGRSGNGTATAYVCRNGACDLPCRSLRPLWGSWAEGCRACA